MPALAPLRLPRRPRRGRRPSRDTVATGLPSTRNRTLRIFLVELGDDEQRVSARPRSRPFRVEPGRRSGGSTTFSFAGTNVVFGRIEVISPAWSTFLSSWKSPDYEYQRRACPAFSAGAASGSGKIASPGDRVVRRGADQHAAVRDHERERVDAGLEVDGARDDRRPAGGDGRRDHRRERRADVVEPRMEQVRAGRATRR